MRDMSIYEERDGLLACLARSLSTVSTLRGVLDMYTAANTEALKAIAGLTAERNDGRAMIHHVRALHVRSLFLCRGCKAAWPCPTIRALGEPS
jgi:hypothetical protein